MAGQGIGVELLNRAHRSAVQPDPVLRTTAPTPWQHEPGHACAGRSPSVLYPTARTRALDSGLRRTTQDHGPVVSPSGLPTYGWSSWRAPIVARTDAASASPPVLMGVIMLHRLGRPFLQPVAA